MEITKTPNRENREHLQQVFESSADAILIIDFEGKILEANPATCSIYGYSEEELRKLSATDLVHPDKRHFYATASERVAKGQTYSAELVNVCKDGTTIDVEVCLTPLIYRDKPAILATLRDITERKQIEQWLRESETRFRQLFDHMSSGVAIFDAIDDGRDFVFVDFNKAAEQIDGISKEELLGKSVTEVFPSARDSGLYEVLQRVWKTGNLEHFPVALYRDESVVNWREQYVYKLPSGELVAVYDDITERMNAAEALQQRTFELSERVKELNCLYGMSRLAVIKDLTLEELLRGTIELIPPAWQYQEITCARIIVEDREFNTGNFNETAVIQTSDIVVQGERIGSLEVGYLEKKPEADEDPFQKEERSLIDALTERLGRSIERIWAEAELQSSEERLRILFEYAPDAIYLNDFKGTFIDGNKSAERITGYKREELIGKSFLKLQLLPKKQLLKAAKALAANVLGKPTGPDEFTLNRKDGSQIDVEISTYPVKIENQTVVLGIARDITERKRVVETLQASEAKYQDLFKSAPAAYFSIGTDSSIYAANKAAEDFTGYKLKELQKLKVIDLYTEESRDKAKLLFERFTKGMPWENEEMVYRRKDGKKVHGLLSVSPIKDADGKVLESRSVVVDITEHKQLEEERQKLEEQIQEARRMESLGVLAGGIAHDFNNLLTGVLGNADLALTKLSPVSPAHDSVEKIVKSARRAADLVSQMLAYSGKGKMITKRIDLSEVLEEMAYAIEESIENNAAVEYNLASDLPVIEADPSQIRQAIQNLVNNALEALGDKGGVISIATGVVESGPGFDCLPDPSFGAELQEGSYVYLRVEDDGCGMDEETQEKMFDPFYSTKFTGRGLGLPAVLGIAQGHEGAISVKSGSGKGTSIMVLFPASEQPAAGQ